MMKMEGGTEKRMDKGRIQGGREGGTEGA